MGRNNPDVDTRPICLDCQQRMDCAGGDYECTYYECSNCGYQYEECDEYDYDDLIIDEEAD